MSEIKPTVATSTDKNEATAEEKDWAAAKAHFESLKSTKPRPVSILSSSIRRYVHIGFDAAITVFGRVFNSPSRDMQLLSEFLPGHCLIWWRRRRYLRKKEWRSMFNINKTTRVSH